MKDKIEQVLNENPGLKGKEIAKKIGEERKAVNSFLYQNTDYFLQNDNFCWFLTAHEEIRVNQWIYYHTDSPRSARSRGFNRGSFYTEDGRLICSTAQEGLIRVVGERET